METWLIGMKLLTLGYVATTFAEGGSAGAFPVVLASLGFVSANLLAALLRPAAARKALLALAAGLPLAACFAIDPGFAVLVPLPAAELVLVLGGSLPWTILPAVLLAIIVPRGTFAAYLLAAGLGLVAFSLVTRSRARMAVIESEADRLRAANESLRHSAGLRADHEDELSSLAQLEERNRLAQDIHDRVGHAIAGGIIQLEAAAAVLDRDRDEARTLMANSVHALREGMESIRAALRGIKPAPGQLGIHRVKEMLDRFSAETGIATRLDLAGDVALVTRPQWQLVIDNLRECLTNTLRHSGARSLRLVVEVMNRIVKVDIRDDGRGAFSPAKGLGLDGMEERTEGLGGKLVVDGTRGFSVIMLLPVEASDAH